MIYGPRCVRCHDTGWVEGRAGEPFTPCQPCLQTNRAIAAAQQRVEPSLVRLHAEADLGRWVMNAVIVVAWLAVVVVLFANGVRK